MGNNSSRFERRLRYRLNPASSLVVGGADPLFLTGLICIASIVASSGQGHRHTVAKVEVASREAAAREMEVSAVVSGGHTVTTVANCHRGRTPPPNQPQPHSSSRSRDKRMACSGHSANHSKCSGSGMGHGLIVGQPAWLQRKIHLRPQHRGVHLVTEEILRQLPELSQFAVGLMHIQLLHTSASLAINENWDPDVRDDMEMMLNRIVPEDVPFRHSCEGPDDMPAHVKACFLGSNLTVPVSDGKLNLGTWQGVWLCEHRDRAGSRKILVTVNGALRDPDRTPLSPNSPIASTSS